MAPTEDAANMERAPNKRPSSPAASSHQNQPNKRLRPDQQNPRQASALAPLTACLHCGAGDHTFSGCSAWCKDCAVGRPTIFCPLTRDKTTLPDLGPIAQADVNSVATAEAAADDNATVNANAAASAAAPFPGPSAAPPKQVASPPAVMRSVSNRVPEKPLGAIMRCLKCGKDGHLPANCTLRLFGAPSAPSKHNVSSQAAVTDGDSRKPEKVWNAARLPLVGSPNMEGVSSERLAMIAVTPEVKKKASQIAGAGPVKSGNNAMPLGQSSRLGLPGGAVQGNGQPGLTAQRPMPDAPRGPARGRPAPVAPALTSQQAGHKTGNNTASSLGPQPSRADGFSIFGASRQSSRPDKPNPSKSASTNSASRANNQTPSRSSTMTDTFNMTPNAIAQANALRNTGNKKEREKVNRFSAHHMGIWADLDQHITDVVHGARDQSRCKNNGQDLSAVQQALNAAKNILRPFVLREKQPSPPKLNGLKAGFARVRVGEDGFSIEQDDDAHVKPNN
ncbi:hypothetical protein CERZMDRAFT_103011 [Cercospora zeae-maydis SCOH1-5]|uniref:CCHC-type domain-containing protein n=1 Tax=Cercospora zeae-maydis SCOH1-5 TaxID=717836 RepID=A0A6A6F0I7_9PEZI|nr:hypothetical protein CERZMDRAFT_103011 [Cercospora zeae-maydis SCOH1-5]